MPSVDIAKRMRVLVACEFSNIVRDAFLAKGHDAYSCDLKRAYPSKHHKRHIRGDVRSLLQKPWDLVIAHPPCTHLCNSGVWLIGKRKSLKVVAEAAAFFCECLVANSPRVCVENPTMHRYAKEHIPWPPTQVIQPWQFGEPYTKRTCLWLLGLPPLEPTKVVSGRIGLTRKLGSRGSEERSVTYPGVAEAMAEQWGCIRAER